MSSGIVRCVIRTLDPSHADECEAIMRSLPEWFGIEDAIRRYLQDIKSMETYGALLDDRALAGFLTVNQHFANAAEIHVMAIRAGYHRQGIGRRLLYQVENILQGRQVRFLQVKTLADRHPDVNYRNTRAFYEAVGFTPLEVFPTLWGEANPCLQMIKVLPQILT